MSDKIRVTCGECGKRLACPATAAGKRIKCPACSSPIAVPSKKKTASGKKSGSRRLEADPYASTVPSGEGGLPARPRRTKRSGTAKGSMKSSVTPHWSRNLKVGIGVVGATFVSNAVQLAIKGQPNLRTAAGKGEAAGQAFVLLFGLIAGIVIIVRSLRAR